MPSLHRHQLVWLAEAGWLGVLARDWDDEAHGCFAHWAAHHLPLVVTSQPCGAGSDTLSLGLPAPTRWRRRRLALAVARSEVLRVDEFPSAERLLELLPSAGQPAWRGLLANLEKVSVNARVYGSHGWQLLSGLDHLCAGSDIDLWLAVRDASHADSAAACLKSASGGLPRLDGELMFGDGSAVAWREWLAWRSGRVRSLLVKGIAGHAVVRSRDWPRVTMLAEVA